MRILAGSMESAESGFLHAGYLSAGSRPFSFDVRLAPFVSVKKNMEAGKSKLVKSYGQCEYIDTVWALQLEGKEPTPTQEMGLARPGALGNGENWFDAVMAMAFFAFLTVYHMLRRKFDWGRQFGFGMLCGCAVMVLVFTFLAIGNPLRALMGFDKSSLIVAEDARSPWEGIAPKRYANPDLATKVIMKGIIADALSSIPYPVNSLTQIQRQVGLPSSNLTPGQAYALKTYGLDGWGRPIRLWLTLGEGKPGAYNTKTVCYYTLTSAGADGVYDTADDIRVFSVSPGEFAWDKAKPVVFARKTEGRWNVLYHRWGGRLFAYSNHEGARGLTGNDLYDLIRFDNRSEMERTLIDLCDRAAVKNQYDPLLIIVFPERDNT